MIGLDRITRRASLSGGLITITAFVSLLILAAPATWAADTPHSQAAPTLTAGQMALNGYWRGAPPPSAPPGGAPTEGVAESRLAGLPPGPPPGGGAAPGAGPMGAIVNKMQPWALAEFVKIHAIASAGQYFSTPTSRCLPSWVPGTGVPGGPAYNIAILVEPRQVTFFAELDRMMRIVHIDQKHPAGLASSWSGHSVGHWEGDTLVVDTTGFNDKNVLANAVPMTSRMHIVQRLRVVDGKLEDKATFDDPGALTGIFERTLRYAPGKAFQEYICAENNYFGGVPTSTGQPTPFTFPKAPTATQPALTR